MTYMPTPPESPTMCIRNLKISTNIRIHPEFVTAPRTFARRHQVDLADDVFPETDFRKDRTRDTDDPRSDERIEMSRSNIHLVRHGAIRLFTVRDDDGDWVRSINLGPSMLLYGTERHPLQAGDLQVSLSILRSQVTPLLANPHDARHIVPGLGLLQDEEPVAYWSEVDSEIRFPGILISCLHGLGHPSVGPAAGATRKRIQFGDTQDDCVIRIKETKWAIDGPEGVEGVRVRLILKGRALTDEFMESGTIAKVNNTRRLVAFPASSVARVHQTVMARMEGTYLPVPPEWPLMGKPITPAKIIALLSQLTPIPLEELRAMDEEIRIPSESTRKRLRIDSDAAADCLKPVAVSSLFGPDAYATRAAGGAPRVDERIDPSVAAVYG